MDDGEYSISMGFNFTKCIFKCYNPLYFKIFIFRLHQKLHLLQLRSKNFTCEPKNYFGWYVIKNV